MKTILLSFSLLLLAGCASVATMPKSEAEMNALGNNSLLHVPVDITGFHATKKTIVSRLDDNGYGVEGKMGQITVFTDPATGKTYDLDGQPLNEKGERILKDGYVCVVDMIMFTPKSRIYVSEGVFRTGPHFKSCLTEKQANLGRARSKWITAGAFLGGGALALSGGAAATMAAASTSSVAIGATASAPMTIDDITDGDTY